VLLTGSAGFIGGAVADRLEDAGHDLVRVDLMLEQAHGDTPASDDTHRLDVRDAGEWVGLLRGVDAVCHQAALVGAGTDVADLPAYAAHNDLGTAALLAAMTEAGVGALVLASSMVVYGEGRYVCDEHGPRRPAPRPVEALAAGEFENRCDVCAEPIAWYMVEVAAPLEPRSAYAAG
jgi:dTDP-L-rhamnose 4-epimerase